MTLAEERLSEAESNLLSILHAVSERSNLKVQDYIKHKLLQHERRYHGHCDRVDPTCEGQRAAARVLPPLWDR